MLSLPRSCISRFLPVFRLVHNRPAWRKVVMPREGPRLGFLFASWGVKERTEDGGLCQLATPLLRMYCISASASPFQESKRERCKLSPWRRSALPESSNPRNTRRCSVTGYGW